MTIPYDQLNDSQRRAVANPAPRLLVSAGPGTGKTEVLAHRIVYMINHWNVLPQEILAVTFSRKAAQEMRERVADLIGEVSKDVRISTLHSESLRMLSGMGAASRFFVSDYEARMLMQDALEDCGLSTSLRVGTCQTWVGLRKAENILPDEVAVSPTDKDTSDLKRAYGRYEVLLTFNRASDLNGLVTKVLRLLPKLKHEEDPTSYIKALLVDEFQDINEGERQLIHALSRHAEKLFVVGDDDQSIYSWRGANPEIIRNFAADFRGQVDFLQESNRCTDHILQAAKAIVAEATGYIPKSLRSARGPGNPVQVLSSSSENAEAYWIANEISKRVSNHEWSLKDIVIICKALNLAKPLLDRFRREGLPAVLWTSRGIVYDEAVINIITHLRVLHDLGDNLALRSCIENASASGIGRKGLTELRRTAESTHESLWVTMRDVDKHPKLSRWATPFKSFNQKIDRLVKQTNGLNLLDTIDNVARHLGTRKRQSVEELMKVCSNFGIDRSISEFIEEIRTNRSLDLAGGASEPTVESPESIAVMSMHSSKGLGFRVVMILGMDNGILPDYSRDLDEQRRLTYVAMSRAKDSLYLCHSRRRTGRPARQFAFNPPSNFISDIPLEHRTTINNT